MADPKITMLPLDRVVFEQEKLRYFESHPRGKKVVQKALIVSAPQGQPALPGRRGKPGCQRAPGECLPALSQPGRPSRAEEIKHRNTDDLT